MFTPAKRNFWIVCIFIEYSLLLLFGVIPFGKTTCILVFLLCLSATLNLIDVFNLERKTMGLIGIGQHSIETSKERTRIYCAVIFIYAVAFPLVFIVSAINK